MIEYIILSLLTVFIIVYLTNRYILLPIKNLKDNLYELGSLTSTRHKALLMSLELEEEVKLDKVCKCGMVFKKIKIRKKDGK